MIGHARPTTSTAGTTTSSSCTSTGSDGTTSTSATSTCTWYIVLLLSSSCKLCNTVLNRKRQIRESAELSVGLHCVLCQCRRHIDPVLAPQVFTAIRQE